MKERRVQEDPDSWPAAHGYNIDISGDGPCDPLCEDMHMPPPGPPRTLRGIRVALNRLVTLNERIATDFLTQTMPFIFSNYVDTTSGGIRKRTFTYRECTDAAHREWLFPDNWKYEDILQACSFDNCDTALAVTSPIMAWLIEGDGAHFTPVGL